MGKAPISPSKKGGSIKMKSRGLGYFITRFFLVVWVIFALFPLYWTLITAFKTPIQIYKGPFYFPFIDFAPSTNSWQFIFFGDGRIDFLRGLLNSILYAFFSALLSVLLGSISAYGLARYSYKYGPFKNDNLNFLIVSQRIMPPIVAVIALYLIFKFLHLLDSGFGMILAYTWFNLPLAVYLLTNFFASIPREIEYAAALDGYSKFDQLRKVILPLAAPGLASAYLLSFFFAWNEFLMALMLTFRDAQTLPIIITTIRTQMEPKWWILSAIAVIALIPPSIVVLYLDKYLIKGTLFGGVR
jgi:multiple sugar transport system permease protein